MAEFQHELEQLEVPRATVNIGAELGRGQSGVVLRGTFSNRGVQLAIKTRGSAGWDVGGAAVAADEALMLEAMLLNGLRHPGIVMLLAVVTNGAPVLICTELMGNGDLRSFLRASRPHAAGENGTCPGATRMVVTLQMLTTMAAKLSSAMAFVEQVGIIHRDIAARNVLVGKDVTDVKVADLGAARSVHRTRELVSDGVYVAKTDHSPARWMALEALREAKFSHKSDVFAFGVLLWEMLSLGQTPWGVFGVPDFTAALANGERLAFLPAFEHDFDIAESRAARTIYAIALRCWNETPAKRPHFHQLEAEFAIHHKVLATTAAALLQRLDRDSRPERAPAAVDGYLMVDGAGVHGEQQCPVPLDDDGYVADSTASQQPTLDADGYVADIAAGVSGVALNGNAAFGTDSSVADAALSETRCGAVGAAAPAHPPCDALVKLPTSTVISGVGSDYAQLADDRSTYAPSATSRGGSDYAQLADDRSIYIPSIAADGMRIASTTKATLSLPDGPAGAYSIAADPPAALLARRGIAARTGRKPSIYLGFEQEPAIASAAAAGGDETRL
jgi:abelson tyrosine-protein kinase 1